MLSCFRAGVLGLLSPLLQRSGYGFTWQSSAVLVWCALRGSVSLLLALIVLGENGLDPTGNTQSKV